MFHGFTTMVDEAFVKTASEQIVEKLKYINDRMNASRAYLEVVKAELELQESTKQMKNLNNK